MKLLARAKTCSLFVTVVFVSSLTGVYGWCEEGKFGSDCNLECHCVTAGQCTEAGMCGQCSSMWEGPTCQLQLENIALNKTTSQGTDGQDISKRAPELAVDGNLTSYSWVQNKDENGSVWWFVDLGQVRSISRLAVVFHDPDPADLKVVKRRAGWSVILSNISQTGAPADTLCYMDLTDDPSQNAPAPIVTLSNCSSQARYVTIYNSRNSTSSTTWSRLPNLEISEVEVMSDRGCSSGTFGDVCDHECGHCESETCNRDTGICPDVCAGSFYGDHCDQTCSANCKDLECVKDGGQCDRDCVDGYYGDFCNHLCPTNCQYKTCLPSGECLKCQDDRYYSLHCNKTCGHNCKDGCDQSKGTCINGCSSKFYGETCNLPCDNCKVGCHSNGSCTPGGCVTGYHGDSCLQGCDDRCVVGAGCDMWTGKCGNCEDNHFGNLCEEDCNVNCIGGTCHRNGTCTDGCKKKSYHGNMCDQNCSFSIVSCVNCEDNETSVSCMKCSDAKYGARCENSCPSNCELCSNFTDCTHCIAGFSGRQCSDECKIINCKTCDTVGHCHTCQDGFFGESCEHRCADDCKTCAASTDNRSESVCAKCKKGKFLIRTTCTDCMDKCTACSSMSECTECVPGSYGSKCSYSCHQNCQECTSKDMCTKCLEGWSGKNRCQCSHNCIREGDLEDWCYANGTCAKGCVKGKMGDTCMFDCARKEHCLECEQLSGRCKKCASGRYSGLNHCDKECGKCNPDGIGDVKCHLETGECVGPCVDGYYGNRCNQTCSGNCFETDTNTNKCDKTTGNCEACKHSHYGSHCEYQCNKNCLDHNTNTNACDQSTGDCSACMDGYFGKQCKNTCSEKCEKSPGTNACNKDTGVCPNCVQKFYGDFCRHECGTHCEADCDQNTGICDACRSNHYGQYCNLTCAQHCAKGNVSRIVCQRDSGECLYCDIGYSGEMCDEPCSQTCAKASPLWGNKPQCWKSDGLCANCQAGYHGDFCEKGCSKNCGREQDSGTGSCDQATGICDLGCIPGWHNNTCEQACNSTCRDHTCHRVTAECLLGCKQEYEGVFCENKINVDATWKIVLGVVLGAILIFIIIGIILIRRFRRKRVKTGKAANDKTNGTRMKKLNGRPEEINPLLNGNTTLPPPTRSTQQGGLSVEDVTDENEIAPVSVDKKEPSDYYNPTTQVTVSGFTEYLQERKMENVDWYKQDFSKLPKGLLRACNVATSFGNRGKCRYKQLYPYDESRVKLNPEGDVTSDFINASYVAGYKTPKAFIAAQGPTDNTINDFWRMIYQKDCGKIVMLTNLFEECKMKCARYWPEADEPMTYGIYEVTMVSEHELPNYTVRHLQATHRDTKKVKDFQHLHFTAWPDRGVPDNPSVILNFRDKVMNENSRLDGPILVHCSAGIGRTGTFVALDYLLRQAHVEPSIDAFKTITDMRFQRTNFVQTDIQYEFVHNAISEALNTRECEVSDEQFSQYYWSLLETCSNSCSTKLQQQFEMVNQMSPVLEDGCFSVGLKEENVTKSRHPDILPLDLNRAFLSTPVKGSNEYINAVFLPTCTNKTAFLITQMPLPHTVTDFWRLVYDQHVSNIVMMNNDDDDDDETIGEYWPSDDSTYGPFRVELISCDNTDDISLITIHLTHTSLSRQTTMLVKLFRYTGWSENAIVPQTTVSLTSLISQVSRSSRDSKTEPVIVHCMDGAERSGLYCAVSAILERLQMEKKINIPQTILQLRARRPQLIKTLEQFEFCYRAVVDYLDNNQIYSNVL